MPVGLLGIHLRCRPFSSSIGGKVFCTLSKFKLKCELGGASCFFLARVNPFRIPIESVAENYPRWYLDSLLALHVCRFLFVANVSISDYLYFSYFLPICLLLKIELTCLC